MIPEDSTVGVRVPNSCHDSWLQGQGSWASADSSTTIPQDMNCSRNTCGKLEDNFPETCWDQPPGVPFNASLQSVTRSPSTLGKAHTGRPMSWRVCDVAFNIR